jgi:1-acyl-sn-glycerol-3-phosphate acyltransferase
MAGPSALRGSVRLVTALSHLFVALWVARQIPRVDEAGRRSRIHWFATTGLQRAGITIEISGSVAPGAKLLVANHVSWLDIVAIHAACPEARFVSKAEARRWPVLGWLIKVVGTLFIERERPRDSIRVVHEMASALRNQQTVAVFLEGTTSSGHELLPFHAGLLQSAISTGQLVQPIALRYTEAGHAVSPSAAYFGETSLVQSVWRVVCAKDLHARVTVLPAMPAEGAERRELSQRLREDLLRALRLPGAG